MPTTTIDPQVLGLDEVDRSQVALVGGKGAHLGELLRIDGVRVPAGFCVTTAAFRRVVASTPSIGDQLARLAREQADDQEALRTLSAELRRTVEGIALPDDLATTITRAVARLGEGGVAVRSSATAEDLPTASFAGQHDTFLDVVGPTAVLRDVVRCWASLFTERAVTYRLLHAVDHREVQMAVVVQRMVAPQASGVLFTADPVTSDRGVVAIEAVVGLGEALVSGRAAAEVHRVRDGEVESARGVRPVLTGDQAVRLAALGRRIEAHLGTPQDVEWCLVDEEPVVVQTRPITTLFPVPEGDDDARRVYVSVGHQQMMTDAMKPLGLSMWQMTALRPMDVAGGRLFVEVAPTLASPASRDALVDAFTRTDPLTGDALRTVVDRGLVPVGPAEDPSPLPGTPPEPIAVDRGVVDELVAENEASVAALRRRLEGVAGAAVLDLIREDVREMKRLLFDPRAHAAIRAGMEAAWWLDDHLHEWLGVERASDRLSLSVPHNVTSEMGLALLDVADVVRPHPAVVALLEDAGDDGFLGRLPEVPGGTEARDAIRAYLDRYGMRCVGEIDISRPRWSEHPSALVPLILGHVRGQRPGEARRRFEGGRQEAEATARDVLERLRSQPGGERRAAEAERRIDAVRTLAGYREYPKYGMVSRYALYRRALLAEAGRLVRAGVLHEAEDIFLLTFDELHDVVRTGRVDEPLLRQREVAFRWHQGLTPPRVLSSDGEVIAGSHRRDDLPPGALAGLGVSAGTVEGRARVVLDMAEADLRAGDILVTVHTDPSWSPLFVAASGLVTEVGGLMTHGAVVAREYGLPAVVGVEGATRRIRDGQRIRVDATHGLVEPVAGVGRRSTTARPSVACDP